MSGDRVPGAADRVLTSRSLVLALVLVGAGLRIWQWAADASLWADEANMALNLARRPARELLGPLDYRQVAAPGWLLAEKAVITLAGDDERVLRLVPLLGSLAALPLAWMVAARTLAPTAVSVAVALHALAIPLIYYGAQLKPYATDVVATLVVVLMGLTLHRSGVTPRRAWAIGLAGAVLPWGSYPAALLLAATGAVLVTLALAERPRSPGSVVASLGRALGPWAVSVAGAALWSRHAMTPDDARYLQQFWDAWFWPMPPRTLADLVWPIARLTGVFGGGGLRYPAPGLFIVLFGVGAWALWRRSRAGALLVLTPIAVTFAASALRVYPFAARVVLFLVPAFLIGVAAGVDWLRGRGAARATWLGPAVPALCVALAAFALTRTPPPYVSEHLRPVLAAVQRERRPGDAVYVYYGGEKAFRYYAARLGFGAGEYVMGGCWREDPRAYLAELDRFRGRPRVWVIVTHALPDLAEAPLILGYLDAIGMRRAIIRGTPGVRDGSLAAARGFLYDLADPARLGLASAATFPIPPRSPSAAGAWSC